MLTKTEILQELSKHTLIGEGRVTMKVLDYSDNMLAPEPVAYRLHYSDISGNRRKVTYYPKTVGFQWG
jgi:hypothetical protein